MKSNLVPPRGVNVSAWLLQLLNRSKPAAQEQCPNSYLQEEVRYEVTDDSRKTTLPPSPCSTVTELHNCSNADPRNDTDTSIDPSKNDSTLVPGGSTSFRPTFGMEGSSLLSSSTRTLQPLAPSDVISTSTSQDSLVSNYSTHTDEWNSPLNSTRTSMHPSSDVRENRRGRRRRKGLQPSHESASSLAEDISWDGSGSHASEQNLESFRRMMSLKSSLQFSSIQSVHSVPSDISTASYQLPFQILSSTTVLMILFPSIKSLSMVQRTLFGHGDKESRTLVQTQTGCRFLRLFKATLLIDCSCFLCLCHDTEYGAHHAAETCIGLVASKGSIEETSQLHRLGIEIRLCNTDQFAACVSKPYTDKRILEEDLLLGTISRSQWGRALYSFALLRDASGPCTKSVDNIPIVWQRNPLNVSSHLWMTVVEPPPCSTIQTLLKSPGVLSKLERSVFKYEFQFYLVMDEDGMRSPYILVTGSDEDKVRLGLKEALEILLVENDRSLISSNV